MASNLMNITNVSDLIKTLTSNATNTATSVVKDASNINSNTLSAYKLTDWLKNKGVTIAQDAAKNFKIGNYTIPKELTQAIDTSGGYGSENQYQQIYDNFVQQSKTFANLNTPTSTTETGQYISPYQEQINTLMEQLKAITPYQTPAELEQYLMNLLQSANQPFTYNPGTDEALKIAQQEVGRQVREQAGTKGTLYSSGTIAKTAYQQGVLIPQYEQQAYQRYADQKNREVQMATVLMQWDAQQADRWNDQLKLIQSKADFILQLDQQELEKFQLMLDQRNADRQYALQLKEFNLQQKIAQIENAYKRVDAIGYVDKETSVILGIPVGQKAQWVKELEMQQKNELANIKKQYENDKKLAQEQAKIEKDLIKYKTSIEEASKKKLMKEQYEYDRKLASYQNSMQSGGAIGSGGGSYGGGYASGDYSTAASYQTLKNSTGDKAIDGYINKYAKMYGVDANLVRAVMKQESSFRTGARSSVGAIGLMQLMPGTAAGMGINPYNVEQNVKGGVKYLSTYLKKYKSIEKALISYNAGPGRANNSYDSLPSETKNYIKKVMANYTGGSGGSYYTTGSGSSGSGVSASTKQVQQYLNNYGYLISVDGKMGPETKDAIKKFQKLNGLTVDGVAGPKTLAKLKAVASKKKTTKLPYL